MNRISPDDKPKAPRLRPFGKSPLKSTGRIIKSQVGGKEEGANPDDRSTTGNPGLNENLGTLVTPDQRSRVTTPPDSTSPLKKRVSSRSGQKGSHRPKTASQAASASGCGNPSKDAFSTANQGKNSQQRQQNDHRSVYGTPFMIKMPQDSTNSNGRGSSERKRRK